MREVIFWVWNGPWWTALIGAIYLSFLLVIAFGPVLSILRRP